MFLIPKYVSFQVDLGSFSLYSSCSTDLNITFNLRETVLKDIGALPVSRICENLIEMECSDRNRMPFFNVFIWESTLIFPGATPYSSFRLKQRKFQSLKKISFPPILCLFYFSFSYCQRQSPSPLLGSRSAGGVSRYPGLGWVVPRRLPPNLLFRVQPEAFKPPELSLVREVNSIHVANLRLLWEVLTSGDWDPCPLSLCHTQSTPSVPGKSEAQGISKSLLPTSFLSPFLP